MILLVTGGTGFIGSHTCLYLLEKGYEIFIIDSHINSSPLVLKRINQIISCKNNKNLNRKIHFIKGDLRDKDSIKLVFEEALKLQKPITGVIHFAGLKSVFESINKPLSYWESNFVSTINLVKVMHQYECNLLIFSSSATIYDSSNKDIVNEENKLNPINPYGNTKFAVENFLNDIFKSGTKRWKIACLRYFNPVGAHPSGLIGESPFGNPNNLFPLMMKVASKKIKELEIYGNDWPTKDGTAIRDYIHVMDLAHAHVLAIDYLMKNSNQIIKLNLGTGKGTSVLEFVKIFEDVNNVTIPFVFSNRREGDQGIVIADNKKMKNLFRWEPKKTIEDICLDGWKWKLKNPNGYKIL